MKNENSVSTSGSGKGSKVLLSVGMLMPVLIAGLLSPFHSPRALYGDTANSKSRAGTISRANTKFARPVSTHPSRSVQNENASIRFVPASRNEAKSFGKIGNIFFKSGKEMFIGEKKARKYELVIELRRGENFSYKKNRQSIENLFKTGLFSDVETEVEPLPEKRVNVYYILTPRLIIDAVKLKKHPGINKRSLLDAIFSLRRNDYYEKRKLDTALQEIRNFLGSRGYFNPAIEFKLLKALHRSTPSIDIHFYITPGSLTTVNKIFLTAPETMPIKLQEQLKKYFDQSVYIPFEFQKSVETVKRLLKKHKYYFPDVRLKETFLDNEKSKVDVDVIVKSGYQYEFKFVGIENKIGLISSIWEKKVFEKWAETESNARILYSLKSKGYLNAEVKSHIEIKNFVKHITFTVKKNRKYKLGNIRFIGNESFPDKEIKKIIKTDDLVFDKFLWLRSTSLAVDREVLRLFYYFRGFPSANILMEPHFREKKADIDVVINEGKKFTVDTILFNGNRAFTAEQLNRHLKTRPGMPFVQQILNEDIEALRNFYFVGGFDEVIITPEISPGTEKSILLNINEGPSYRVGHLIVIGASDAQAKLLQRLFPLKINDHFNRLKIDNFKSDIENSSIFTEFTITKIKKSANTVDVLVKAIPDKNKFYGFGAGGSWTQSEKISMRGTLEYQQRNIFNGYSSLSGIFQLGNSEGELGVRGVISYDTPFLFRRRVNSELKFWVDNEQYPSYNFTRFGLSETLIQKMSLNSYLLMSLSLYSTELNELDITPSSVDRLNTSLYTTALRFSYVKENRNDPFNPTSGYFFSSDLKMGVLMADHHYPFIKFRWNYQKLFKLLKKGTLAFTIRNGLADGDLSITERFFAGGVNTFRGTKTDRLGPIDPIFDKPRGGNALFLVNLEATFPFPVIPSNELYYAVFADIGNVYERVDQFSLSDMEKALGFGLRLKTQLGPLRLDFAWNLERKPEGSFRVQIGIGNVL
jgi:outer membrane protein insertion porin family